MLQSRHPWCALPAAATLVVALVPATVPTAAKAELTGSVYLWPRLAANDNRRLREGGAPTAFSTVTDMTLLNSWTRPTYALNFNPKVRVTRYTQEEVFDSDDYFFHLDGVKQFERDQFSAQFDYEHEGTATTELTDSGRFDVNVKRTTYAANSSWRHALSEIVEVSAFGGLADVSFEEAAGSGFVDYDQANAGLGLRYALTEQTTWTASSSISRFATPSIGSETISYTIRAGFEHAFDETLNASFDIGQNVSNIKQDVTEPFIISFIPLRIGEREFTQSETASGEIISALVEKEFERSALRVAWNRYFSPSSLGARQRRQEVEGNGFYEFTSDWTGELRVNYREQEQEGSLSARFNALEVITVLARMFYQITPTLRGEVAYTFLQQSDAVVDFRAHSNEIMVGLRYSGEKFDYIR